MSAARGPGREESVSAAVPNESAPAVVRTASEWPAYPETDLFVVLDGGRFHVFDPIERRDPEDQVEHDADPPNGAQCDERGTRVAIGDTQSIGEPAGYSGEDAVRFSPAEVRNRGFPHPEMMP